MEAAARELAAERDKIAAEASHATAVVVRIVDDIRNLETAKQIVKKFVTVQEMSWQLEDLLKAIFDLDAKSQSPQLRELKKTLNRKGHRRNRAQARDPQLIEEWKWLAFLEAQVDREAHRWQDYGYRLALDANAVLDVVEYQEPKS